MRVRSHVGGSGGDSEQSDSHEPCDRSILRHGNSASERRQRRQWYAFRNNKLAFQAAFAGSQNDFVRGKNCFFCPGRAKQLHEIANGRCSRIDQASSDLGRGNPVPDTARSRTLISIDIVARFLLYGSRDRVLPPLVRHLARQVRSSRRVDCARRLFRVALGPISARRRMASAPILTRTVSEAALSWPEVLSL
jgi:hypothetical protein